MSAINIGNLFRLPGVKVTVLAVFLFAFLGSKAQETNPLYDIKRVHFGFSLVGNKADLKYTTAPDFYSIDTLKSIRTTPFIGFGLGGVLNVRILEHFDARLLPGISFAQRNLDYQFNDIEKKIKIESVYLDLPLMIKYKSVRHRDRRFYAVGGVRYSYDLTSQKDKDRSPEDPIVALNTNNFFYEAGVGLDIYFEYFKFSPEIKFSNTFNNVLVKDDYVYTKSLSGIFSRLFQISLHFE